MHKVTKNINRYCANVIVDILFLTITSKNFTILQLCVILFTSLPENHNNFPFFYVTLNNYRYEGICKPNTKQTTV